MNKESKNITVGFVTLIVLLLAGAFSFSGGKDFIAEGGAIERTEDFKSLEDQVGEIIFLATGGENAKDGAK